MVESISNAGQNWRARQGAACCLLLGALLAACRPEPAAHRESPPSPLDSAGANRSEATLDPVRQKYIWDIEHTAFELEKKFGSPFAAALKERDPEALQKFCLPEFSASILDTSQRTTIEHGFLRETRHKADSQPGAKQPANEQPAEGRSETRERPADAAALMAHLCTYLDGFTEIGKIKCRVLDLHAAEQRPESGQWEWTLYLTGVGKDSRGAPVEFETKHRLSCRFRGDDEIAAGRILRTWRVLEERFRAAEGTLFEEVTAAAGLDKVDIRDNWKCDTENVRQYYTQMAVEDFDRDGFFDLAVASANGRWRLLQSSAGGEFRDVTAAVGLPSWADEVPRSRSLRESIYLATWIDVDNDCYPDLLLGDRLFRNLGGKSFEDITEVSGLTLGYQPKGAVVADYDCDGWLDLYVLYQHDRQSEDRPPGGWIEDDTSGAENHLWRNTGEGRFENVTAAAQAGGGRRQSFAAVWLHANQDHYPDLYVANDFGTNVLLINQGGGSFQDVSQEAGVSDYGTSMGVAAGDVTGDGAPDIYVANMFSKMGRRIIAHVGPDDYPPGVFRQIQGACAGNRLYAPQGPGGKYHEFSELAGVNQVGWAYAPALADFDADGWLDIYATAGFLSFQRDKPDG